ncbi:MAG TPA: UdgX family uracil-DNA binding protein [Actinomycetota bacterium]|nr:UdgX family uracil-DNA binding protein [Actinomycetota bacterium]
MAVSRRTAEPLIPHRPTLSKLRNAAAGCTACELHRLGTQTVFGEGPAKARVMMVGEQPGDREDLEGHPFVGPAGKLLDRSLEAAGIARDDVYLTNVVKHFRWEATRGKRRIHRKPAMAHISACRPWLDSELSVVRPEIVVCLGATATQAIAGRAFKLSEHRGELLEVDGMDALVAATVHPSSVLRAPDDEARRREREAFVSDLVTVRRALAGDGAET